MKAVTQSYMNGSAVEKSRRAQAACDQLSDMGWTAEQCAHALKSLFDELNAPIDGRKSPRTRDDLYDRAVLAASQLQRSARTRTSSADIMDAVREVSVRSQRRAQGR